MIQGLWFFQAGMLVVIAGAFIVESYWAWRDRKFERRRLHMAVITSGLAVISLGNVLTSYATAIDFPMMRDTAGIIIRLTLVLLSLYLVVFHPRHER